MEKIYSMHELVGLQLFWSGTPAFSSGTPPFCQMGVLNLNISADEKTDDFCYDWPIKGVVSSEDIYVFIIGDQRRWRLD